MDPALCKTEKRMEDKQVRYRFRCGIFKVSCSALVFQGFDENLAATIKNSPRRVK